MAEQILSQEEIDALMSAMSEGKVDFDDSGRDKSIAIPYDLTSSSGKVRDQFHALNEVHDKFILLFRASLGSLLQQSVDIKLISSEVVKFEEFIAAFSAPCCINTFAMDPLIGSSLLVIEPNICFSILDSMLGGEGLPPRKIRDFSLIELKLLKRFSMELLLNLEKSWELIFPVTMILKKTETKPEFVHMVNPGEVMVSAVFTVRGTHFEGNFYLAKSYLMLESIKEKLSSKYFRDMDAENKWVSVIKELLLDMDARLGVEVGNTKISVRQLLDLNVGNIINLNRGPEDPMFVTIETVPKFLGIPGLVKGNKAVQITGNISELKKEGGYV